MDYSQQSLRPALGMFALPYASVGPELSQRLSDLYRGRVASIPWLPPMWIDYVDSLHGQNGYVLLPAPASKGEPVEWLDTPDKRAVWDELAARVAGIVRDWGAGLATKGRVDIDRAQADLAFWERAHRIAYVLATPVRVVERTADAVDRLTASPTRIAGLAGLALFAYFVLPRLIAARSRRHA